MSSPSQRPFRPAARLSRSVPPLVACLVCVAAVHAADVLFAQDPSAAGALERRLLAEPPEKLAAAAKAEGDAARGAIVFHQPHMACQKCHVTGGDSPAAAGLGPDLTAAPPDSTDRHLVESVLRPSQTIRKGFETAIVATADGRTLTGIVAEANDQRIVLRDAAQPGRLVTIAAADVDERRSSPTSLMPAGQVAQLGSRQQFLDLIKYLIEIRDGGRDRARELQPAAALIALELPEYERRIDHAGFLRTLDQAAFDRGRQIYERLCVNCHGTHDRPGSLPTSLRFASGKFKSGSDPYTMYQTLTRGFGLMTPQAWMAPSQKYDVIHYIREAYLKSHNPAAYTTIDAEYLASLPVGDTRGPAPKLVEPWATVDYGPTLIGTYETGRDGSNFAYKGVAVRLDPGPGGVARGRAWTTFDHDTLRVAAAWSGVGFIDWQGIHFDGRHNAHPHLTGDVTIDNPTGPGWADPESGDFTDDRRTIGRDGRRYGPLPRDWGRYRGLYHHGDRAIVAYEVGGAEVLETYDLRRVVGTATGQTGQTGPAAPSPADAPAPTDPPVFVRSLRLAARPADLLMLVATRPADDARLVRLPGDVVRFGGPDGASPEPSATRPTERPQEAPAASKPLRFDGTGYVQVSDAQTLDMHRADFTLTARIKTRTGGTIFARAPAEGEWAPDGVALFIRGGRLTYDIGWVGAVESKRRVDDDRWHDVALRWTHKSGLVELLVDGKPAGRGVLKPKSAPDGQVARIGFASSNFPDPSAFQGELRDVRFFQLAVPDDALQNFDRLPADPAARWPLDTLDPQGAVADSAAPRRTAVWKRLADAPAASQSAPLLASFEASDKAVDWQLFEGRLCLRIPAGSTPLNLQVRVARAPRQADTVARFTEALTATAEPLDWTRLTSGGPARWPQVLTTQVERGSDDGPLAVDVLTPPVVNPWLAPLRLTGVDFFEDGARAVVCAWDGDVWIVSGLDRLDAPSADGRPATLDWRRIASGLFQPLGIKRVDDQIFVTCRDQLVVLRDRNGDGETDFYECWNNDHQVTEHFHEFAMGLQTDANGDFYYAKSARHALPAVVPHHGTLLRIARDGSQTEILATGFRAANGVCLNPDGTFVVTDQEGHWNPKNRINWVRKGGFYGNMFGYHDVTDSSDSAMEPPLCWITNAFDRSPAELLWAPRDCWGELGGSLLNLSYGYGRLFVTPFEEVNGKKQGGMCALPIPALPTGVMRGRFHPVDKQLYACGMFAWAGSATQPGGFYRLRATGKPWRMPIALRARVGRLELGFTDPLDRATAETPESYSIKTWSLKRTAGYGSQHHDERTLKVTGAELSADGRTVTLRTPDLQPTWGMEIVARLKSPDGRRFERTLHNSVFELAP